MCPKCQSHLFTRGRDGPEHISPRFGACPRWTFALDDKVYGNVYEAKAGDRGFIWYAERPECPCGSKLPDLGLASGKVELYHPKHPVSVTFDDGSQIIVECPEMHLGPYCLHTAPVVVEQEDLEAIAESLRDFLANMAAEKEETHDEPDAPVSNV